MEGFLTHCGAAEVTAAEAFAVPLPDYTRSHRPVSYQELTEFLRGQIEHLGLEIIAEAYALNRKGQHFFAKFVMTAPGLDTSEHGISAVLRQSYNKQFSPYSAFGTSTFICDNQSISGNWFQVMKRNTRNGWDKFKDECILASFKCDPLREHYDTMNTFATWKDASLTLREGYQLLGELYGEQLLTANQASVAFQDWREPRHDFGPPTVYRLYQDCTEGLKKGPVATLADRHIALHKRFRTLGERGTLSVIEA
jgi:hypothetical protein